MSQDPTNTRPILSKPRHTGLSASTRRKNVTFSNLLHPSDVHLALSAPGGEDDRSGQAYRLGSTPSFHHPLANQNLFSTPDNTVPQPLLSDLSATPTQGEKQTPKNYRENAISLALAATPGQEVTPLPRSEHFRANPSRNAQSSRLSTASGTHSMDRGRVVRNNSSADDDRETSLPPRRTPMLTTSHSMVGYSTTHRPLTSSHRPFFPSNNLETPGTSTSLFLSQAFAAASPGSENETRPEPASSLLSSLPHHAFSSSPSSFLTTPVHPAWKLNLENSKKGDNVASSIRKPFSFSAKAPQSTTLRNGKAQSRKALVLGLGDSTPAPIPVSSSSISSAYSPSGFAVRPEYLYTPQAGGLDSMGGKDVPTDVHLTPVGVCENRGKSPRKQDFGRDPAPLITDASQLSTFHHTSASATRPSLADTLIEKAFEITRDTFIPTISTPQALSFSQRLYSNNPTHPLSDADLKRNSPFVNGEGFSSNSERELFTVETSPSSYIRQDDSDDGGDGSGGNGRSDGSDGSDGNDGSGDDTDNDRSVTNKANRSENALLTLLASPLGSLRGTTTDDASHFTDIIRNGKRHSVTPISVYSPGPVTISRSASISSSSSFSSSAVSSSRERRMYSPSFISSPSMSPLVTASSMVSRGALSSLVRVHNPPIDSPSTAGNDENAIVTKDEEGKSATSATTSALTKRQSIKSPEKRERMEKVDKETTKPLEEKKRRLNPPSSLDAKTVESDSIPTYQSISVKTTTGDTVVLDIIPGTLIFSSDTHPHPSTSAVSMSSSVSTASVPSTLTRLPIPHGDGIKMDSKDENKKELNLSDLVTSVTSSAMGTKEVL